ncbi:uncharacterized protein N7500_007494 [Penicillium coprophilum]|uniref:uncharacterized protein n=1 Tax=Penicillium coprophilum TaxID=36646 RepID=UPI00238D0446|nr:uncharacterized protein N7500_007494 [Penicillium coprophilum]KAJ5165664.1 hypothetical protein N7500_007494 [Penicillium coprophilum]
MVTYRSYSAHGQNKPDHELNHTERLVPHVHVDIQTTGSIGGHTATDDKAVDTQGPQTEMKTKRPFDWTGSWGWEIGSAMLSVVGLVLLVAFLVKINATPYANWQYTASPNTIVSVITTITKAALLVSVSACLSQLKWNLFRDSTSLYNLQAIDQASRGPWGSLEVLLRGLCGSRMGSLTYVGAFLTVLALAVDPFAQQILTFPSRTVPALNATALIQSAHQYYSLEGQEYSDIFQGLAPSLLISIMSGLSQTNSPLEPQCDSSSCKFSEFVTFGLCSECEDVTAETHQICHAYEDSMVWRPEHISFKEIPVNCSYQSPNNFSFDIGLLDVLALQHLNGVVTLDVNSWTSQPRHNEPVFDIQSPLVSFITTNYSTLINYTLSNVTAFPPKPSVTECAIYYCERKYAASTYLSSNQSSRSVHVVDTQQLIPRDTLDENSHYLFTDSIHFGPPKGSETLSKNSSYSIDHHTFTGFRDTMGDLFNSSLHDISVGLGSSGFNMATILRTGNLGQLLDSMTTSVTDTLRASPHGNKIHGQAYRVEMFVDVRWPWIILPAIVTLGSIALLLGTVMASKQQNAVLWKSTVLPLLSSHLNTTPEHEIASLCSVDEVQRVSKNIRAIMIHGEGPLTFTET